MNLVYKNKAFLAPQERGLNCELLRRPGRPASQQYKSDSFPPWAAMSPPVCSPVIVIKTLWKSTLQGTVVGHFFGCPANQNASSLLLVLHLFYKQEVKLPSLGPR